MAAQYLHINPEHPDTRQMNQVVDVLKAGGLVIYPTDTVYGLGCDITKPRAIEKICNIKGLKRNQAHFAFICYDLSHIAEYSKQLDNVVFKAMKRATPGPYTFILNASSKVPKLLLTNKKTVGIRVPDNEIPRNLVKGLGNPIITTSIKDDDEFLEYTTDPEMIYERFKDKVDIVIDGGYGNVVPSTVIDCTSGSLEVIREGMGELEGVI